jgi:hypothetical protein
MYKKADYKKDRNVPLIGFFGVIILPLREDRRAVRRFEEGSNFRPLTDSALLRRLSLKGRVIEPEYDKKTY